MHDVATYRQRPYGSHTQGANVDNPEDNNYITLNSRDSTMITLMQEIKDLIIQVQKENGEMKSKLDILCTKVDRQNKIIETQGRVIAELQGGGAIKNVR